MQRKKLTQLRSESLLTGSILAAFIAGTPYFFYLYEGFPDVKIWETSFFGFDLRYESGFYQSVNVAGWLFFSKLIPLLLLLIWFFTCKHWWYHSLIIPICMYIFQIYSLFNEDIFYKDSVEIYYLAPLILFAFIFLYTVRMKIFDRIHNIDLSELERVSFKGKIRDEDELTNQYPSFSKEDEQEDDDDDEPLFMG